MEDKTIDIKDATTEQLKSVAFDMILERDRVNANLDAIGRELEARLSPVEADVTPDTAPTAKKPKL